MVKICSHKGNVFAVEPPLFVELQITETEPGFKGDTATGATKPATVETGAVVYVPLFVEQDDVIKIDTRTGEYLFKSIIWLRIYEFKPGSVCFPAFFYKLNRSLVRGVWRVCNPF